MDERFVEKLSTIIPKENIFLGDALEFDGPAFFKKNNFKKVWLVSNLPYNVSVPLTTRFLEWPEIVEMSLMYQKEVADKILPRDKNEMNSLHCLCASFFDLSNVCFVPPGAFIPPPKVDSQVLHFKRREDQSLLPQVKKFENFLRVVFGQRRKQLGGILKKTYGEQLTEKILMAGGIDVTIRAETLTYSKVMAMYEAYSSHP
jgi:16S rRNA (adenine1518-N6/adenine1519-N6)-dimethyltransferase